RCASGGAAFSRAFRRTVSFQIWRFDVVVQTASAGGTGFSFIHREQTCANMSVHGSIEGSTSDASKWTRAGAPGTTGSAGGATAEAAGAPASGGDDAAFPEGATGVCAHPSTTRDHSTAQRADLISPPVMVSRCTRKPTLSASSSTWQWRRG